MCGRYALHSHPQVVALQFGLGADPDFKPSYNVCPGTDILVVRENRDGARVAAHHRWGLVPHWAKDPASGNKLAGRLTAARGDTVAAKPAFRDAFLKRRCLVPASGFYEWHSARGRKSPWYLRPLDAPLFALAGIAACWKGLYSVSLITTEANEVMQPIHERMPVIVPPERYAAWLDRSLQDAAALMDFVKPYAAERMAAHAVSPRVNQPGNDDAALLEPIPTLI
ncbi:MAG: SOS response-associated peptidase [Betaproteobacteria bacterium]